MADHIDGLAFRDLKKAGGLARGGAVHIEHVERSGLALRGEFRGAIGQVAQIVHLLVGEKKVGIGPAFDSLRGADLDKPAAQFEDVEFVAVLDGPDGGGFRGQIFSQIERDGSDIGDAGGGLLRRMGGAGGENQQRVRRLTDA